MSVRALWYEFSDFEREMYDRQKLLPEFKLFSAADLLNNYSDHSRAHVTEVMEQCEAMFECLRPWLRQVLPDEDENGLLHTLMIAAKYHDIRMSPSDEELSMLESTDGMHALILSGSRNNREFAEKWRVLRDAAAACGWNDRNFETIAVLCGQRDLSEAGWKKLRSLLVDLHDEIKQKIRKRHAVQGTLFMLDRADEIRKRYGADVDVTLAATLVNLHSTSSSGCKEIGFVPEDLARKTRECVESAFALRGETLPQDGKWLRMAVTLASILRLADARRSGSRLRAIGGQRLRCEVEEGVPSLYICENGLYKRITNLLSHDILCAECCSDFGGVTLANIDGVWEMRHDILVRNWDCPRLWKLFCEKRMGAYVEELASAALRLSGEMRHRIVIRLPGARDQLAEMKAELDDCWRMAGMENAQAYASCFELCGDE